MNDQFFIKQPKYVTHTTDPKGNSSVVPQPSRTTRGVSHTGPVSSTGAGSDFGGEPSEQEFDDGYEPKRPQRVSYAQGNPAQGGEDYAEELDDDHFVNRQYSFGPPPANSKSDSMSSVLTVVGFVVLGLFAFLFFTGMNDANDDPYGFNGSFEYYEGVDDGLVHVEELEEEMTFGSTYDQLWDATTSRGIDPTDLELSDIIELSTDSSLSDSSLIDSSFDRLIFALAENPDGHVIDIDLLVDLLESGILDESPDPAMYMYYVLESAGLNQTQEGLEVQRLADMGDFTFGADLEAWEALEAANVVVSGQSFDELASDGDTISLPIVTTEVLRKMFAEPN